MVTQPSGDFKVGSQLDIGEFASNETSMVQLDGALHVMVWAGALRGGGFAPVVGKLLEITDIKQPSADADNATMRSLAADAALM